MNSIVEKSKDTSRALLFGLLASCIFSKEINENCPLSELRINLSVEEKHEFVMDLSDEEIKSILVQHDECYEKRLSSIKHYKSMKV